MSKDCCQNKNLSAPRKGFWSGLLLGLLPHTFCIGFIIFSIIGAATATGLFKKFLLLPNFFLILVVISIIFATLSAIIYLKRINCLTTKGVASKWRYLATLYGLTVGINLLFFLLIFPLTANINNQSKTLAEGTVVNTATLKVAIPCSGHAPLIIDELKQTKGIVGSSFRLPNLFEVNYQPEIIDINTILDLEIFKSFKASVV